MKIENFKTIYSVDYPLSYSLLDHFGRFSEMVSSATKDKPFSQSTTNLNLVGHSIVAKGQCPEHFKYTLSLKSLNCVTEYSPGHSFAKLHKHPTIKLADSLLSGFKDVTPAGISTFNRVGVRSWVIVQDTDFTFENVRRYIFQSNQGIESCVRSIYSKSNDVMFSIESENPDGQQARVNLGPYQKSESSRYFSADIDIEEGIILDIDIWNSKVNLPGLSLTTHSQSIFANMKNIAETISKSFKGALQGD